MSIGKARRAAFDFNHLCKLTICKVAEFPQSLTWLITVQIEENKKRKWQHKQAAITEWGHGAFHKLPGLEGSIWRPNKRGLSLGSTSRQPFPLVSDLQTRRIWLTLNINRAALINSTEPEALGLEHNML